MSEAPVSFVVGEPELDPDTDPSEVQEIEDSFPSESSDNGNSQMQVAPGLVERRRRLRGFLFLFFFPPSFITSKN